MNARFGGRFSLLSPRDPRRAEATLTESTRNLVLGAVIAVLVAAGAFAAVVVDGDDDGFDLGQGTTTTTQTAPTTAPTTSTTTGAGEGDGDGDAVPPGNGDGNGDGNGMTSDGTGDMTGDGVIAETGGESLLMPAGLALAGGILLRARLRRARLRP